MSRVRKETHHQMVTIFCVRTFARFTSTSFLATRNRTTSKCPPKAAFHSAVRPSPSLLLTFTLSTSDCTVLRSPFSAALIKSTDSLILAINNDPSNKQSRREWWECCYIDVLLFCWHGMWQQKTIQKLIWFVERSRQQSFQPFCWWSRMQSKQLISIQSNEIKSLFLYQFKWYTNGISFMNFT